MMLRTSFKVDHSFSPHLYNLAYEFGLDNLFTSCNISLAPSPVQELDLMVRVSKYHICHFLQDPLGWLCAKQ
jgi:hypothetical protein